MTIRHWIFGLLDHWTRLRKFYADAAPEPQHFAVASPWSSEISSHLARRRRKIRHNCFLTARARLLSLLFELSNLPRHLPSSILHLRPSSAPGELSQYSALMGGQFECRMRNVERENPLFFGSNFPKFCEKSNCPFSRVKKCVFYAFYLEKSRFNQKLVTSSPAKRFNPPVRARFVRGFCSLFPAGRSR